MILRFSLPYRTIFGQRLAVCGSHPSLGNWQPAAAVDLAVVRDLFETPSREQFSTFTKNSPDELKPQPK